MARGSDEYNLIKHLGNYIDVKTAYKSDKRVGLLTDGLTDTAGCGVPIRDDSQFVHSSSNQIAEQVLTL